MCVVGLVGVLLGVLCVCVWGVFVCAFVAVFVCGGCCLCVCVLVCGVCVCFFVWFECLLCDIVTDTMPPSPQIDLQREIELEAQGDMAEDEEDVLKAKNAASMFGT